MDTCKYWQTFLDRRDIDYQNPITLDNGIRVLRIQTTMLDLYETDTYLPLEICYVFPKNNIEYDSSLNFVDIGAFGYMHFPLMNLYPTAKGKLYQKINELNMTFRYPKISYSEDEEKVSITSVAYERNNATSVNEISVSRLIAMTRAIRRMAGVAYPMLDDIRRSIEGKEIYE